MIVWYGQVGDTDEWRAVRGLVVRKCSNAADAYNLAVRLAGHSRTRVQKRQFPGPVAEKTAPTVKAKDAPVAASRLDSLLAKNSKAIRLAMISSDYDDIAEELFLAEEGGKNRSTVLDAIHARRE